ncbi:hypothetical protein [Flavobacterium sp.]|uniref:hypothetical protein n=1 Tax=Flavobacterium sp. TaxID=239 RepID=UPI003D0B768D
MRNSFFRLFLIIITAIISFNLIEFTDSDFVIAFLLFIGLVLNYKTTENTYDTFSNYFFWIIMFLLITILKKISFTALLDSFLILLVLKVFVLLYNYIKYKNVSVTSLYLSKIWIFTFFLYQVEIILNSTHGFKSLCFFLGLISIIETFLIIFRNKEWKFSVVSFW